MSVKNTSIQRRSWIAVEFDVKSQDEDLSSWLAINCGATGCEVSAAINNLTTVKATFENDSAIQNELSNLKARLEEYGLAYCLKTLREQVVPEEDWLVEWKKGFVPFTVGNSFLISPPWCIDEARAQLGDRKLIQIEPGMAFGTGLHSTTQYCLREIERLEVGKDVVDVGTGSGILAMGVALLHSGCTIRGVDIESGAIQTASENLKLNGLSERITLLQGSTEQLANLGYDTIISNLTYEDISALLLEYLRILRPNGIIICAGIIEEKLLQLESDLKTYPLNIEKYELDRGWVGVTLRRIGVVFKGRVKKLAAA